MTRKFRATIRSLRSDNPKAAPQTAIQKPKWVGLSVIAFLFVMAVGVAPAQQPKKHFRICYLSNTSPSVESPRSAAVGRRLRELGYFEGQNISIDYRYGEGDRDRAAKLAAELVVLNCDVIVVFGGYSWIRAVMDATKTIPIVMTGGGLDPVDAGLIKSLARPGGNVTGITNLGTNLASKRLEIFKEALPKLQRVAVLYELASPSDLRMVKEDFPDLARALKFTLQPWEVKTADDFEKVFAAMSKPRPDGLYALPGGLMAASGKRIVNFALKNRIPTLFGRKLEVEAGGLMSYAADDDERYRQIAWYVDKILTGRKPADLPVQQPMRFEFVVNQQTADKIGVTINTDVLARATKIIR